MYALSSEEAGMVRMGLTSAAAAALIVVGAAGAVRSEDKVDFASSVKPILEAACVTCHGPDEAKGHYRLDTRDRALAGGDASGHTGARAISPGKPDESLFIAAIEATRKDRAKHIEPMPPRKAKRRLSDDEKALLRRWVAEGASWPDGVTLVEPAPDDAPAAPPKGGGEREAF
jgi:hypothetical protein